MRIFLVLGSWEFLDVLDMRIEIGIENCDVCLFVKDKVIKIFDVENVGKFFL